MSGAAARRSLLVVAALALAAGGLPCAPAAQASSTQRTLFEAPRELLGADAGLRTRTLAELRVLGVRDLRIVLYWKNVAPAPASPRVPGFRERDPSAYDWGVYGPAIDEAAAAGFRILLTVSGPVPKWATGPRRDQLTRPSPLHYQRFFEAVARRFGSRVATYSVWNEPNHPAFLLPQYTAGHPVSGRIYRKLYLAARSGLKAAGQAGRPLLFGETAPRGTSRVVAPLRFLRQALCLTAAHRRRAACNRLAISGLAHHPYTTRAGPGFVPPNRDDVTIGVLPRLDRFLERAERARAIAPRTPVDITEFGIQSLPDRFSGVPLARQAEYRALSEQLAYQRPRVRTFAQYLLRDDDPRPGPAVSRYSGFESGLRGFDGRLKPAYDAFRLPLVARPTGARSVALWGLVRPARGVTRVVVEARDAGARAWRPLVAATTDGHGVWTARTGRVPGRRYRVRWADPSGAVAAGPATAVRALR